MKNSYVNRHSTQRGRAPMRGFSLIEALVALLVVSLGMLAIAGFQVNLAGASDMARQRMEAIRLAQDKMEQFRTFRSTAVYAATITNGSDGPFVSNATFNRNWTVTQAAGDTERWVNVVVSWTDRRGNAQQVTTQSSVAKFDPKDIGTLATGPGGVNVRKPKNRNVNIPYPAVTLSGGTKSAFIPPPGNLIFIFDNKTGDIVQDCQAADIPVDLTGTAGTNVVTATATALASVPYTPGNQVTISGPPATAPLIGPFTVATVSGNSFTYTTSTLAANVSTTGTAKVVFGGLTEGINLTGSGLSCSDPTAPARYLLSGFVRFVSGNNPSGAFPAGVNPFNNSRYDTKGLLTATPLHFASTANTPAGYSGSAPSQPTCFAARQITVGSTNTTIYTISSSSISGSTMTVNTSAAHGFVTGQSIAINGLVNTSVPNSFAVLGAFTITVTSTTQFTYNVPAPAPTSGTITSGTAQLVPRITIAEGATATGYSSTPPLDRFVSYACVVTPVDTGTAPRRWWGRVELQTDGTWDIGSGSGQFKICRYSADYNGNNGGYNASAGTGTPMSNSEHPLWYREVTAALDNQNYLVIDNGENCPTDKPANPLGSPATYADNTTADHQPTGVLSFQCGVSNCAGGANKVQIEPTTPNVKLDMN